MVWTWIWIFWTWRGQPAGENNPKHTCYVFGYECHEYWYEYGYWASEITRVYAILHIAGEKGTAAKYQVDQKGHLCNS